MLTAASACKPREDAAVDSLAAVPLPAPAQPSEIAPDSGRVTEYGIGSLRAGMTFAAANDSLRGALKAAPGANLAECDYVKWEGGPSGLLVMVVENKIARIETSDTSVATSAGARVGDSEERIQSLYPGRVTVTPHKYGDGHYLTVQSANADDSLYRIIFETEKNRVTTFRAGIRPAVEYVEGCS
ncbi:MAG: hypothetical protein H7Z40_20560 [Phycisphaerae bacterium]|nr:hypothetical protein [Gemmatimonadaceae bacterium]